MHIAFTSEEMGKKTILNMHTHIQGHLHNETEHLCLVENNV